MRKASSRNRTRQKDQQDRVQKNKRGDSKRESIDNPEIPDRRRDITHCPATMQVSK